MQELLDIQDDLRYIIPGLAMAVGAILLLIIGIFFESKVWLYRVIIALLMLISIFTSIDFQGELFSGFIVFHPLSFSLHTLIWIVIAIIVLLYPVQPYHRHVEFYFLLLALALGAYFMLISGHLLMLYLAIELTSFSSYMLTMTHRRRQDAEGAIKYLIFGGAASAMMLFGIGLHYHSGGTLSVPIVLSFPSLTPAVWLILTGLLFKSTLFPMFFWVPNTYQTAPSDAVAAFAIIPKISGIYMLYIVLEKVSTYEVVFPAMLLICIITLIWGTLGAIKQIDFKRLLAYGSIVHGAFLLVFLILPSGPNASGFLVYSFIYSLMTLGVFYYAAQMERANKSSVSQHSGLGIMHPWFYIPLTIILISLVGLPPTAGFFIKMSLFSDTWLAVEKSQIGMWAVYFCIGIASTAVALYYYIRLPYLAFLKPALSNDKLSFSRTFLFWGAFFAALLLWFFISPEIINNFVFSVLAPSIYP